MPDPGDPLRVTVVGVDPEQRRRLADILATVAGVAVVGTAETHPADVPCVVVELDVAAPAGPRHPGLAARQLEVLVAYAESNELLSVVARRLGMNEETLKTHLRRIRAKYREVGRPAPTRRDLYVRAVEDGLLPPPS